ncbi:MAG: restriction endonuclease subunit S [Gammaproteobacteria bacterium]|nr:restriction endonuclease subunit S [Gammaproteobacteria bacterium]MBU0814131.1 restriction endonuclease subunit S [Gammaproteobacteria bacterium]MBU1786349.1 restriction endonuclease subunit S [Gammaproteobacteria bacterium]
MSEWQDTTLGEIFKVKHGFAFKGEYFTDEPQSTVLVTPGNFAIGGGFQDGKRKYYCGPVPEDYVLKPGQVVVTMTDLSKESDTLGYAASIPDDSTTWLHNQRVGLLEFKPAIPAAPRFIQYLLRTHEYRSWVLGSATGTTVKHTSPGRIESFETRIPSIEEQHAIAHILGTLDDKIELNRRMNETLEAMARAIFQSWFVDFDPVRAKASGESAESICQRLGLTPELLALFPDSLEDSELGEIPRTWGVNALGDLCSYLSRGISPKYVEEGGVCVLNQKCIRDGKVSTASARRHDPALRSIAGRELAVGDILVNSTGTGTLGRVAQVMALDEPTIVDSHVTVVRANSLACAPSYLSLTLMERQAEIEALGEGSTGQTELSRARLAALQVLTPPLNLMQVFDERVKPFREASSRNDGQNITLSQSRDTLLPKLLAGEIFVGKNDWLTEH